MTMGVAPARRNLQRSAHLVLPSAVAGICSPRRRHMSGVFYQPTFLSTDAACTYNAVVQASSRDVATSSTFACTRAGPYDLRTSSRLVKGLIRTPR
ncbi:hypothetical protein PENSPDRAFT_449682 [Peniophora sp. CONT]|nr:hypothetical protein PENSPDRAFT_449682 [Peniophora sp. CONT]